MIGPGLLRLLLALLVVVHHSTPLRLGSFAVFVFFILSGYWITRMWDFKYSQTKYGYLTFLISRWWRLAPVFLACLLLYSFSEYILRGVLPEFATNFSWWLRQLPIASSAFTTRLLPPSWSIDVEMQFYIVAPILVAKHGRWNNAVWWMLLLCSLSLFIFMPRADVSVQSANAFYYFAFFLAGILLYRTGWLSTQSLATWSILLFLVTIIVLLTSPTTRPYVWSEGTAIRTDKSLENLKKGRELWSIFTAFLVIPFISRNVRRKSGKWDTELGNLAYPLYLFHWLPREWYYSLVNWRQPVWYNAQLFVQNMIISLLGAWLILRLIDRPSEAARTCWINARLNAIAANKPSTESARHTKTAA